MIRELLREDGPWEPDLERLKLKVSREHRLERIPRNSELLTRMTPDQIKRVLPRLQLKRVRSISGVNVIGVMSAPRGCPHGRCSYCPMEPGVPMSYTGFEPAAMRARQHDYDPYAQLASRLAQLRAIGHSTSKVELVIQGGTFPAAPMDYQEYFVKRCLDAITGQNSSSLDEAKKIAEKSRMRNVGLTVETKPDWAKIPHVDQMLAMGVTRVEIGVQTLYDDIYALVNRGHTLVDVVESFRTVKDAGLKLVAHMMPGLPGSNFERDLEAFRTLFEDRDFKPDMLKIYPCLVIKGTKIYDWWRRGEYKPLDTEQAVELIARVKEFVPPWLRIMRVQREIPARLIAAGPRKSNLRELALARLASRGRRCRCIRCREVGHRGLKESVRPCPEDVRLLREVYEASGRIEVFLSIEDPRADVLIGYLRLRIPSSEAHRPEIAGRDASIIRELHVYGPLVPLGEHDGSAWQHRGYGRALLSEAERVSREDYDRRKILVTSAVGTKEYYMRAGYQYDGPYLSKSLYS